MGAAAALREKTGVAITGPHKEDAFWLDMLPQQSQMFGFAHTPAFTPDRWLEQGDKVQVGQCELEVYFCPGHTPGHIVLLSQAEKLAWVGDVLFAGSIGRTDFPRGDHGTLIKSITETLLPLGDEIVFIPGPRPQLHLRPREGEQPLPDPAYLVIKKGSGVSRCLFNSLRCNPLVHITHNVFIRTTPRSLW